MMRSSFSLFRRTPLLLCSSNNNNNNNNNNNSNNTSTTTRPLDDEEVKSTGGIDVGDGNKPKDYVDPRPLEQRELEKEMMKAYRKKRHDQFIPKASFSMIKTSVTDQPVNPHAVEKRKKRHEENIRPPLQEFTGEKFFAEQAGFKGTDTVPMGANVAMTKPGSVMRPSSVSSSPKPQWMSNVDRRFVTAPLEYGKSTIDTRREWFRVMHYNMMVDKFHVPERVSVNKHDFTHHDSFDEYLKLSGKGSADINDIKLISGETASTTNSNDSSSSSSSSNQHGGSVSTTSNNNSRVGSSKIYPTSYAQNSMLNLEQTGEYSKRNKYEKLLYRPGAPWHTTPISNVDITLDGEANTKESIEHFGKWHTRGARIADEVVYYDPDILTINEINKAHFDQSMWRALRSHGYGALWVSARSQEGRRRILRDHKKPIEYRGDIGNAVFYHKGRFVPMWQPGMETSSAVPYIHFVGLRDKVMNLCVFLAVIQLTAGDGLEAIRARENEARGVVKAMHHLQIDGDERMTSGALVCGDMNNVYNDEPCVNILRDKFRDAHDVLGGCRWTSWYKRNKKFPFGSQRHREADYEQRNIDKRVVQNKSKVSKVQDLMKERAASKKKDLEEQVRLLEKDGSSSAKKEQEEGDENKKKTTASDALQGEGEVSASSDLLSRLAAAEKESEEEKVYSKLHQEIKDAITEYETPRPDDQDDFALAAREKLGVVKCTSDYVMYEDRTFSVLRVLDVPPDDAVLPRLTFEEEQAVIDAVEQEFLEKKTELIRKHEEEEEEEKEGAAGKKEKKERKKTLREKEQELEKEKRAAVTEARLLAREYYRPGIDLLPNEQFPSHHIPLVCDVTWNRWSFADPTDANPNLKTPAF